MIPRAALALAAPLLLGVAAAGAGPACPDGAGASVLRDANFPDPFVARFGKFYHAYATGEQAGGGRINVQLIRSRDLAAWSAPVEVLPAANLPAWVDRRHPQVWAPEAIRAGGRFILYFNARHAALTRAERAPGQPLADARILQRHCLGAAIADRPEGPFKGIAAPLVCSEYADGVIDASPFADAGSLYLYYKDDGNCCGRGSAIFVQGLSADGLAALGPPVPLVANDDEPGPHDDWEWRVVEAPSMVRRGRDYWLFYSGNFYGNANYAVGALKCASPRGPCADPGGNPILYSHAGARVIGPGHQSVLATAKGDRLFFHGWNEDPDAEERPGYHKRCLYSARLDWLRGKDGTERPVVRGGRPQATSRPAPTE